MQNEFDEFLFTFLYLFIIGNTVKPNYPTLRALLLEFAVRQINS